jgi:hypothetical protein
VTLRFPGAALLALGLILPAPSRAADNAAVRPPSFYVEKALAGPPDLYEILVRTRIAQDVEYSPTMPVPGMFGEGKTMLQMVLMTNEARTLTLAQQDLRNFLKQEVLVACADLASVRAQAAEARRAREALLLILGAARELYAVGRANQSDVLKAQTAVGKMEEQILLLESRERLTAIRLNTLSNLPPNDPVPPLGAYSEFPFPYSREQIVERFREKGLFRQVTALVVYYGQRKLDKVLYDVQMEGQIGRSYSILRSKSDLAALYRATLIPQAEQAHRANLAAYQAGRADFASTLDGALTVFDLRREHARAVGEMHAERARLEYAVSGELREAPAPAAASVPAGGPGGK